MGGRVVSDERHGGGSNELGSSDGGHERSRQSGPGHGGSRKTENGLSEHFQRLLCGGRCFEVVSQSANIGVFLLVGSHELYLHITNTGGW